jgi:hypothetical protein
MAYNHQQDYHSGEYPRQNMYADPSRPYADPPSPAAPDDYGHPDQYYHNSAPPPPHGGAYYDNMPYQDQYSAGDFISPERDGRGIPGGRQTTYPPASSDPDLLDKEDAFAYEKPALQQPVTRGSIAAQVRSRPPSYQLEEFSPRADPPCPPARGRGSDSEKGGPAHVSQRRARRGRP